jgi:hypothetical protein
MKYYQIVDDPRIDDRWVLGTPAAEPDAFEASWLGMRQPLPVRDYQVKVLRPGREVDFVLSASQVPIVSENLREVLEGLGDPCVQFLTVRIDAAVGTYFAVHAHRHLQCLDETRSKFSRQPGDKAPPGRPYLAVYMFMVDPRHIPDDAHMFRIADWRPPVIVSEVMKDRIEASRSRGPAFHPVG